MGLGIARLDFPIESVVANSATFSYGWSCFTVIKYIYANNLNVNLNQWQCLTILSITSIDNIGKQEYSFNLLKMSHPCSVIMIDRNC